MNDIKSEDLVFHYAVVMVVWVFFYSVLLQYSKSRSLKIIGFVVCSISLLTTVLFFADVSICIIFAGFLICGIFPSISIILALNKNKIFRVFGKIGIILFLVFIVLAAGVSYDHHHDAKTKYSFGSCSNYLTGLIYLQKEFYKKNDKYTNDLTVLYDYGKERCIEEDKKSCDIISGWKHSSECKQIVMSISDNSDFKIEAWVNDRTECYICITPEGRNRSHFQTCTDERRNTCPPINEKLLIKQKFK